MFLAAIYHFPCFSCGDPAGQVKKTIEHLHEHNITYK